MPTKLKRCNLSLPPDLQEMIEREAELEDRPVANHIIRILKRHFAERQKDAHLFTPIQPREARRETDAPHFRYPDPLAAEQIANLRESVGRDKK